MGVLESPEMSQIFLSVNEWESWTLIMRSECLCAAVCLQPRTLQSVPEGVSMSFATMSNHALSQQRVRIYGVVQKSAPTSSNFHQI